MVPQPPAPLRLELADGTSPAAEEEDGGDQRRSTR